MNQTYQTAKLLITNGRVGREHMLACLDVFLMAERITMEQYAELLMLLPAPPVEEMPDPETPADPEQPTAPPDPIPEEAPREVSPEEFWGQS